ncbi:MAG TPA: amidohydrolase family protein, partial [Candidatus Binatus sp.]|nr:amidohydrolase family protein [Candidatus Binatus sp.]
KRDEVFRAWSRGINEVAMCPNVAVKLGGIGSLRSGYDWHERAVKPSSRELSETLRPYIEHCIEAFGVDRCMFESNFPVEKASNTYVNLWNGFKLITEKYSASERAALFHETAARVYRIV